MSRITQHVPDIYPTGGMVAEGDVVLSEIGRHDYEDRFITAVATQVVNALRIPWGSKDTVQRLLETALESVLKGRKNLLQQYLHSQLDIIVENVCRRYEVEAETNYQYATHAKLNDLVTALVNKNTNDSDGVNEGARSYESKPIIKGSEYSPLGFGTMDTTSEEPDSPVTGDIQESDKRTSAGDGVQEDIPQALHPSATDTPPVSEENEGDSVVPDSGGAPALKAMPNAGRHPVAEEIEAYFEKHGMSPYSNDFEVSGQTITNILRGDSQPSIQTVASLKETMDKPKISASTGQPSRSGGITLRNQEDALKFIKQQVKDFMDTDGLSIDVAAGVLCITRNSLKLILQETKPSMMVIDKLAKRLPGIKQLKGQILHQLQPSEAL